jgi:hypothetical protein
VGERIKAGDVELWVERQGQGPDALSSPGWATPRRRGSHSSTGWPTATVSPPSTTAGRGARPFLRARSRRRRWPTTPARCCGRSRSGTPRGRVLDGQRHRAGAGPPAPRARPQPGACEHVRSPRRPVPLPAQLLALAAGGGAERARPSSRRSAPGSTRRARTPTVRWTKSSRKRWPSPAAHRGPFKRRSTSASRTTRRTAFRRSPRRRWCCPANSTSSCRRASVELSPRASRTRTSRSCPGRRTSPSGRSETSSTPASTPSDAESRRAGRAHRTLRRHERPPRWRLRASAGMGAARAHADAWPRLGAVGHRRVTSRRQSWETAEKLDGA